MAGDLKHLTRPVSVAGSDGSFFVEDLQKPPADFSSPSSSPFHLLEVDWSRESAVPKLRQLHLVRSASGDSLIFIFFECLEFQVAVFFLLALSMGDFQDG